MWNNIFESSYILSVCFEIILCDNSGFYLFVNLNPKILHWKKYLSWIYTQGKKKFSEKRYLVGYKPRPKTVINA